MSRFFERNVTLKLFSIAIAIILWTMSPYNRDPYRDKAFREIPLKVTYQEKLAEKNLMLASDIPDSYSFEVWGRTSNLQGLDRKDINVYIDLSRIKEPGENRVPVEIKGIPIGIEIKQGYDIKVNVDRIVSKSIPVILDLDEKNKKELEKRYSEITPKFIEIKGAESFVKKVAYGKLSLSLGKIEEINIIERSLPVQLMDESDESVEPKYITQNPEYCVATIYPSREIPVDPVITGTPAQGYVVMGSEIRPGEVEVSGLPQVLNNLGTLRTEFLDIEGASTDIQRELKLQEYEGIYLVPGQQSRVQVLVRIEKIVEKTVEFEDVELRNIPSKREAKVKNPKVAITIRGPLSYITEVDATNVRVYVDLEGASKGERLYPVQVENIPEGVELINVEPSGVDVSVK